MELSRSDFQILNVLKEHQCTNYTGDYTRATIFQSDRLQAPEEPL